MNDTEKGTMTRAEGQLLVKFVKTWLLLLPGVFHLSVTWVSRRWVSISNVASNVALPCRLACTVPYLSNATMKSSSHTILDVLGNLWVEKRTFEGTG